MRYYPPLPYYLLATLQIFTANTFLAANWFILLCALAAGFPGAVWVLFSDRFGLDSRGMVGRRPKFQEAAAELLVAAASYALIPHGGILVSHIWLLTCCG